MAETVTFYDYTGSRVDEVACRAVTTWSLLKTDKARITLPLPDVEPKITEELIRYSNLVLIEDARAGDWVGVLRSPESWNHDSLELTAFGPDILLEDRRGSSGPQEGRSGELFRQIIDDANLEEDTRLRAGSIDVYGEIDRIRMKKVDMLVDVLKDLRDREIGECRFTHAFDAGGHLYFVGDWSRQFGVVQTAMVLREGHNLEMGSRSFVRQGRIFNDVRVKRTAAVSEDTPSEYRQNTESRALYGLRQHNESTDRRAVALADRLIKEGAQRRTVFAPTALDVGDTFAYLGLGDVVKLETVRTGFGVETWVRILGKTFDDSEGKMALVVEEVVL